MPAVPGDLPQGKPHLVFFSLDSRDRGEWITRASGGEGALDTPGPLCIIDFIGGNGLLGRVGGRGPWTLPKNAEEKAQI